MARVRYPSPCSLNTNALVFDFFDPFNVFASIFSDYIKCSLEKKWVDLPQSQHRIRTIVANKDKPKTPLVMIHGLGGGVGVWVHNIDSLAEKRPVYAFDLLGFGRSSRHEFSHRAQPIEKEFVESIEEWRKEIKIDKMALLGHSLGGYLASAYSIKYPENREQLFLVDPWGFPEESEFETEPFRRVPTVLKEFDRIFMYEILAVFRAAGPLGPRLMKLIFYKIRTKFDKVFDDNTILDYIYHCNAQRPTGEAAFRTLSHAPNYDNAKRPMVYRGKLAEIHKDIPITFINGSHTWLDTTWMDGFQRNGKALDVVVIKDADHHVHADKPVDFNNVINKYLDKMDVDSDGKRKEKLKEEADWKELLLKKCEQLW
ncbi:(Lyso)-N-acylphosphatidylethanolamine lipase-like [Dreissena polymorpha]|uniref:(Lyso)-N-acylphosphatidylethanolamine lipase-like n=1 Tax=Dreissena polymorpha TaxID=45954 RepID=UPI002264B397|nr:(Lyso)-N-acylphosphatidylethanolamine lipase-like [Dreissena polymorpha]